MIVLEQFCFISTAVVAILLGTLFIENVMVTGSSQCAQYEFPCENGECIDSDLWCDSHVDCSDGSDEKFCKKRGYLNSNPNRCGLNYFVCGNGPCIPVFGRCDGIENCEDSSDEEGCEHYYTTPLPTISSSTSAFEGSYAARYFTSLNSSQNSVQIKPFSEMSQSTFSEKREIARTWILSQRRDDFGWGDETARALMALYFSDVPATVRNTERDMLMIKQLEIQIFIELTRNRIKPMKLANLALFINALLISCKNPKNFYGENLVQMLRDRVNAAHKLETFINPSLYLALCINNASAHDDITKLQEIFNSKNYTINMIDIQALALMTTACIFRKTNFLNASMYDNFKMKFLHNVKVHGFPGNVYEAALLVQALQEIKVTLVGLTDFILKQQQASGSFGDVLATYLIMPILAGKNMVQMNDRCGQQNASEFLHTEVLKNAKRKKMHVQYSLKYGFSPEVKQTIQMRVAEGTHFFDIMKFAQEINPKYRFKLSENREVPVVYSIGEIPNDAEKGIYWTLFKTSKNINETSNEKHWVPYTGDVKELILADGDKTLFWYRPL